MKTNTARAVVMFLASSVVLGALSWVMASSVLAATSAQFVYERPETRTMPSPLPRVPQAPPAMLPEGVVVEHGSIPPPAPRPPEEQPPPIGEVKPPPGEDEVPFVGTRLPVTGFDALLILIAAGIAAGVGIALRRAASIVPVMSRSRLEEITFAVPEPAVAAGGLPGATGGDASAELVAPGRGRGAGALLVLGAVAVAGGLGLVRRRGGTPARRRAGSKTATRGHSRRVEPTGSLLVSLAVPALARRLMLRPSPHTREPARGGGAPRGAPAAPPDEGATQRMVRPGR